MSEAPKYWAKAKRILSKRDKVMKALINNYKDGNLITRNDVFFSLCKSIIGQQISVAAANSVFLKFKKKCKNKINSKTVSKLSFNSLKSCGLSRQKVKGIRDLAKRTLDKSFKPFTYFNNMLPIFAAAIVGGIGNPFGAFLGGYVIAFSEIFLTYAYKKFFMYVLPASMEPESLVQLLSTDYKFAVSFSILVIVLLYRPNGIFKGKVL